MAFNSLIFLAFFGIVALIMGMTNMPVIKKLLRENLLCVRHWILLVVSYVFYSWWDWRFAFLLLGMTAVVYFCSLGYAKIKRKFFVAIGVAIPLVVLGFFKYFNFFAESFKKLFCIQHSGTLNIILPLGISFYIFQALSYIIDVYKEKTQTERSFLKLALYISFFPQVVSGPVVKARDFLPQLSEDRNISFKNLEKGIQYFVFGLFKKIVIADNIAVGVNAVFNAPENYHAISILLAVLGYSIQIYCDFSGYSDMAIGCAKALGYDLTRNFNMPYLSKNITEFWKRWHISLSSWLMEYLYIPLGGNRKGKIRTYFNLFLTMLIGGLWHGAAWNFVIWGALHGIGLCVHKLWMRLCKHDKNYQGRPLTNVLSAIITYLFVSFCWIFFRAETFQGAFELIQGIFAWQNGIVYISSWMVFAVILSVICSGIAMMRSLKRKSAPEGFYPTVRLNTVWGLTILLVVIGLIIGLAYTGGNPFIYFQF